MTEGRETEPETGEGRELLRAQSRELERGVETECMHMLNRS